MHLYEWDKVTKEELNPAIARQMINGDTITVARMHLKKGCSVPEHSHHNEQISMVESGRLDFIIDGKPQTVMAGQVVHIPAHVPHSAVAPEDCYAIDIFSPVREDWVRGDDAYLRK